MKLLELRKEKKLSQEEVANDIQIQRATYANYETQKTQPDINILIALADYFGVTLDYLCDHKTNTIADFGTINTQQKIAVSILLKLPETYFYEFLGRLKTTADILKIQY